MKLPSLNLFGEALEPCGSDPQTGYYRDGCCNTSDGDHGLHTVCVSVTDEFLVFSKARGNDLSTAVPEFDFPGLVAGDRWCLCASRWLEAEQHHAAPRVHTRSTHQQTLELIPMALLTRYAADLN